MPQKMTGISQEHKTGFNKTMLFWIIVVTLPIFVLLIPTSEQFTSQMRLFFSLTLAAILLWAFEIVPSLIVSIGLCVAYLMFNLAPAAAVFGPWGSYIPWLIFGGMILTNIFEETGFLKRIAYWCILKVGGSYRGIIYGLTFSGVILAILISDIASRAIMFAALGYSICKSLELKDGGKASSGIMLASVFAALNPGYIFYTSAAQTLIAYQVAGKFGVTTSWMGYFVNNGIITLLWCFVSAFIIDFLFKPDEPIKAKEFFVEQYATLGKIDIKQKKLIVIFVLMMIGILSSSYLKIEPGWLFVWAAVACYLPGVSVGTSESVKRLNYGLVIFVTATMAIGAVSNVLGAGKFISGMLYPMLAGSKVYTVVAVWVFGVLMNFVMTPLAAVGSLTEPLVQLAQGVGVSPIPVLYAWNQSLEQIIFPYEYALVLLTVSYGYLSLKNLMKAFGAKMLLNILFILVIAIPYWKIIGVF